MTRIIQPRIRRALIEGATEVWYRGAPRTVIDARGAILIGGVLPPPPEIIGAIQDRAYLVGTGPYTIDLATKFLGATSYLIPDLPILSLDGAILRIDPHEELPATEIIVQGRNTGGTTQIVFGLSATLAPFGVAQPDPVEMTVGDNVLLDLTDYIEAQYALTITIRPGYALPSGAGFEDGRLDLSTAEMAEGFTIIFVVADPYGREIDLIVTGAIAAVVPPAEEAPTVTAATIGGSPVVGGLLTAQITATGTPPPAIAIQWRSGGVAIPGATAIALSTVGYEAGEVIDYTYVVSNGVAPDAAGASSTSVELVPGEPVEDGILVYAPDGTAEIEADGDVITLTFTGGAYTGEVFTFSAGAVAAGPHFPAASVINGTGTIGQPMTLLRKGFHISDAEAVPVALVEGWAVVTGADSFEWVGSGDPTYTPSSGGRYAWVQQASDGNGTVVNLSNVIEVTIPGTAPDVFASRPNGTLLSAGGFGSGLMWESSPNRGEVRDGILCPTGASGNMTLQRRLQTVSADQFAEAVIKLPAAAGWSTQEGTGIAVRINLDNGRGIFAFYSPTNSGGVAGGWHRVSVYGEGGIGHPVNISAPFEADREYTYRLEAEGSIFRFYVDDALIGTADARNSAGDIGIYARGQTAGTRTRPGVKQFDGGNL